MGKYVTKDSGERAKFVGGMERDTEAGKPRYDLCWKPLYKRWAEAMGRGAEKYKENNWKLAIGEAERSRFKSSAERHLMQWLNDENDEDHAAAVIFNLAGAEYIKSKLESK